MLIYQMAFSVMGVVLKRRFGKWLILRNVKGDVLHEMEGVCCILLKNILNV